MAVFLLLVPVDTVQEFTKLQTGCGEVMRSLRTSFVLLRQELVDQQVWLSCHFEDAAERLKKLTPEKVVGMLWPVEVLVSQGQSVA
jgi:hypothetical protein